MSSKKSSSQVGNEGRPFYSRTKGTPSNSNNKNLIINIFNSNKSSNNANHFFYKEISNLLFKIK